jgi:hypothetical protein
LHPGPAGRGVHRMESASLVSRFRSWRSPEVPSSARSSGTSVLNRSERTITTYLISLGQAETFLRAHGITLEAATRADLEAFMADVLTRGRAPSIAATYHKVLKLVYAGLVEEESSTDRWRECGRRSCPRMAQATVSRLCWQRLRGAPRQRCSCCYSILASPAPTAWPPGSQMALRHWSGRTGTALVLACRNCTRPGSMSLAAWWRRSPRPMALQVAVTGLLAACASRSEDESRRDVARSGCAASIPLCCYHCGRQMV